MGKHVEPFSWDDRKNHGQSSPMVIRANVFLYQRPAKHFEKNCNASDRMLDVVMRFVECGATDQ